MRKRAIGIMTGTSLDGIDIVLAEISGAGTKTKVEVVCSKTYLYDEFLLEKIIQSMDSKTCTAKLICSLNVELAEQYSKCVFALCQENNILMNTIDFIASHGQTIYHISEAEDEFRPSSLQLGDGSVLANLTGITVVSNFRNADIAKGGQGAPLVSYADFLLFRDDSKSRILQNIGGISNSTCIPKNAKRNEVFAFDNGPGNMMIDYAMSRLYDRKFDENGAVAKQGHIIQSLFDEVVRHEYFKRMPPKSTGRELFGINFTNALLEQYKDYAKEDIITTLTHITAYTIAMSYEDFILPNLEIDEVIISGGGVHNQTLIGCIREYTSIQNIYFLEDFGYLSNFKEALAFLILGHETLQGNPSNLPSATGASGPVILGQISRVFQ